MATYRLVNVTLEDKQDTIKAGGDVEIFNDPDWDLVQGFTMSIPVTRDSDKIIQSVQKEALSIATRHNLATEVFNAALTELEGKTIVL